MSLEGPPNQKTRIRSYSPDHNCEEPTKYRMLYLITLLRRVIGVPYRYCKLYLHFLRLSVSLIGLPVEGSITYYNKNTVCSNDSDF
jgi:hypothetical protein